MPCNFTDKEHAVIVIVSDESVAQHLLPVSTTEAKSRDVNICDKMADN
jgi:hypothetical protein